MSVPADWTTRIVRASIFSWWWASVKSYARIRARDQTADANKLECSWPHARADFRRHSREHQSSISVYWPQDDEFTVTRMSTALTRPKLMLVPGDVLRTLCELPNTSLSPWHDAINQAASGRINVRTILKQVYYIEFPKLNRLHNIFQRTSVSLGSPNKVKIVPYESEEILRHLTR